LQGTVCLVLHAVRYPFDCPNIVCLVAFPNINQSPKQNYPSQVEKTSRYPKENEPEVFLNTYPYTRGGQLFLFGGHFEKAAFSGEPHLLMREKQISIYSLNTNIYYKFEEISDLKILLNASAGH